MSPLKRQAHFAGLLYLVGGIFAPIGLLYVPGRIIVRGDAAATADNIRASETLFRVGIASEVMGTLLFLFVVLALYHLFKGVNQRHATLMATLLMLSFPISFVATACNLTALDVASRPDYMAAFDASQLDNLSYVFLRLHSMALTIASIFWGLWLFPFGWLVIRCGFIPRLLGVSLMIAGAGYVVGAFTSILMPELVERLRTVLMVTAFFEVPIMFWLLIWGAREKQAVPAAA